MHGGSGGMVFRNLKLSHTHLRSSVLLCSLFLFSLGFAQQQEPEQVLIKKSKKQTKASSDTVANLQKFEVSGYIQSQYQWGEKGAELRVGTPNENHEASFDRFGVRRGRVKLLYQYGIASGVFQPDITEKGILVKDAFLSIKDPWFGMNVFKVGIFNRPFGHEIGYSSAMRESPERSTIFRTLFPEERDVGAQLTLQPTKTSSWNFLKLEAGLFYGNGIQQETDGYKDFIGHLSVNKHVGRDIKFSFGLSYYHGGVYQGSENIYVMKDQGFDFSNNTSNKGQFAKREYIGFDSQLSIKCSVGMMHLRGEYLFGTQPCVKSNSKSPNESKLPSTDTYIRNFGGGYVILVQDFVKLPFSALVKYDWYDPNVKISKSEIGLNGTGKADIMRSTLGLGLLWRPSSSVRLQTYYEVNKNEITDKLSTYVDDIKDDSFTLRLQYTF